MHILSGKSKCIDRSTSRERERERERCVFFLNFVIFSTLRTRLRISKFRVYLCKKFWSTRLHYKRHLRRWRASESVLVRKCSDSSVVRGLISGLLQLVSKLSDITCTCLALDLVINARAGQLQEFSGGWKEKWVDSAESYRRVFDNFLPHFYMHIYRFCLCYRPHSKITNTSTFSEM